MRKSLVVLLAVVILAFPPIASAAGPAQGPVQAAVQWLHTQQFADGGFGMVVSGQPTSNATMTSDVVYALALAGEDPGGPAWTVGGHSALDALAALAQAYAKTDPGQAAKVARAVTAAGRDPHSFAGLDLIATIQAGYNPDTGRFDRNALFPLTVFRSAVAIEALQRAKVPVDPKAYDALRVVQASDGGWPTAFIGTAGDVDTTGKVLQVLGRAGIQPGCNIGLTAAGNYLASVQTAKGAWAVGKTANANSTALAITGLRAIGRDPNTAPFVKGGQSGWEALLSYQEPSGAFVYSIPADARTVRLAATTDAMIALLEPMGQTAPGPCPGVYLPLIVAR